MKLSSLPNPIIRSFMCVYLEFWWFLLRSDTLPAPNPHFYAPNASIGGLIASPERAKSSPSPVTQNNKK